MAFGFIQKTEKQAPTFEIFEELIEVFHVFIGMLTQFNFAGMGSVVGFNYGSLDFVMNIQNVQDKADCFWKFRRMEQKAITILRDTNDKSN